LDDRPGRRREEDGLARSVVDHLPGAVTSAITRLRTHSIEGPWIVMATLTGIRDYRIILGDGYWKAGVAGPSLSRRGH
jgi:hypothetical protein